MPPPVKMNTNYFREIKFNNMIQSPYSMKTMTQATPLTGKMEMHNWLYNKIDPSRSHTSTLNKKVVFSPINTIQDGNLNLSQNLERYVSVLDTQTQNAIFNKDLINYSGKLVNVELEEVDKSNGVYVKDERKKEMINLYLK
jgi:hypothetical protein